MVEHEVSRRERGEARSHHFRQGGVYPEQLKENIQDCENQNRDLEARSEELNFQVPVDKPFKPRVEGKAGQGVQGKEVKMKEKVNKHNSVTGVKKVIHCGVGLCMLTLCLPQTKATTMNKTEQNMPEDCMLGFQEIGNDCPDRTPGFDHDWKKLNDRCCVNFPETKLQCRMNEANGVKYSILACSPDHPVPPGKIGELVINGTGYPELDLKSNCAPGTYRSNAINSSFLRFQYCEDEKTKEGPGMEKVCDRGPSADDLFVCKKGYHSSCRHGFNDDHDSCSCDRLDCDEGSQPFRNLTGSCADGNLTAIYGCMASLPDNSTVSYPSTGGSRTTARPRPPASTTAQPRPPASTTETRVIAGVISCVVTLFVISFVIIVCWCIKRQCGSYNASEGMHSHLNDDNESAVGLWMDNKEDDSKSRPE